MARSIAVDPSAVARVVGIQTIFKDLRNGALVLLPQRIAVIGQGSSDSVYSTTKQQVTSASQAGALYGYGSPIHLAVKQLLPTNGDGVGTIPVTVYPLVDAVPGVASVGEITPTGTQLESAAYRVVVNGVRSEQFVVATGATIATVTADIATAVNSILDMPVKAVATATKVTLTSKWKGLSANDIYMQVEGSTTAGITFAVTQPTGGLVNPSLAPALAQFGSVWETMVLNCLNPTDTDALNQTSDFGEGRWGSLVRKPLVSFVGNTDADVQDATAVTSTRKTDRVNSQLVSPGSIDLPFVTAARQLARIAVVANENPACDYGSQQATGLNPGADGDQWDYVTRDLAVKAGCSTVETRDNVVTIQDVVTHYHPTGDEIPAYRYVCDIVKLQNIIFNLDLIFANAEWDGAPLIPDNQPTTNPKAKKPKMAVAAICSVIDSLGLEAIISDPEFTKKNTFAEIDTQNPKRLNISTTVKLSGNTNILAVDLNFGFNFGTAQIVG